MQFTVTILTVIIVVAAIWIILETKRFKHKMLAVFLIFMVLFTYFSFTFALKGSEVNLSTVDGIKQAGSIYLSWLGSVFVNVKSLTANAIHMDWGLNKSATSGFKINATNLTN